MAQEPKGTTIVVTGAGSGNGYAITRRLLEAGSAVAARAAPRAPRQRRGGRLTPGPQAPAAIGDGAAEP